MKSSRDIFLLTNQKRGYQNVTFSQSLRKRDNERCVGKPEKNLAHEVPSISCLGRVFLDATDLNFYHFVIIENLKKN